MPRVDTGRSQSSSSAVIYKYDTCHYGRSTSVQHRYDLSWFPKCWHLVGVWCQLLTADVCICCLRHKSRACRCHVDCVRTTAKAKKRTLKEFEAKHEPCMQRERFCLQRSLHSWAGVFFLTFGEFLKAVRVLCAFQTGGLAARVEDHHER